MYCESKIDHQLVYVATDVVKFMELQWVRSFAKLSFPELCVTH